MDIRLNDQGGVIPDTRAEASRAKAADLGTLPMEIMGTNCGNCKFVSDVKGGIGVCLHPKVNQIVSARMCCAYWDAHGFLRVK
jgi:hypothetical protein